MSPQPVSDCIDCYKQGMIDDDVFECISCRYSKGISTDAAPSYGVASWFVILAMTISAALCGIGL